MGLLPILRFARRRYNMDSSIARDRLSYVIKPDSITTSQGDFLATHVAIKKLHLLSRFDIMPTGGKDYSEEAIYKKFVLNPENKHQFIAVYGQSGTGKSHLIRWFEAKFQYDKPENEVVLFIRRSDNTLKGTIRQLLATAEVKEIANREVFERLVRATVYEDENKLKGRIYHDFINEVECDDESHDIRLTNVRRKRLTAFLYNEVVQAHLMSIDGPIERIYSKVAENSSVDRDTIAQFIPEDFFVSPDLFEDIHRAGADPKAEKMARELMADESGTEDAQKIAAYLNQFVNDVIQRCAGIEPGDFRDIFQDIRRELYRIGKNLTLFIEDVTSFTGVDDALLDALIVEHTGMNEGENLCRISSIVGTTSNYLERNFRDNHKDRITQYIFIPSDAFDENGIFEFVGRYLNTMSLPEDRINLWMKGHATAAEYPVHDVKEGAAWEFIPIENGKELCLYPFTKNCIRYLYKHELTKGHQTPRYIIRDIIEPIVTDMLENKAQFPSIKYNIVNVNTTLSFQIHNQVKDVQQAERLLRFLSIWGDGSPDQYTQNGEVFLSSVKKEIIEELGLPLLSLSQGAAPSPKPAPDFVPQTKPNPTADLKPNIEVPVQIQEKVSKAVGTLSNWANGQVIDISATGGTSGVLRRAQEDICDYLWSSINWQTEGISPDNVSKVKKSTVRLVTFENQTKARNSGFYIMPANWESVTIISAFIRWREFGSQSWNYTDSDLDAYLITSWSSRIQNKLISAVNEKSVSETSYIEAAVAAEMYRMILCGEFREKSLKNLSAQYLFDSKTSKATKTYHSKEWNSLVTVLSQKGADIANRETVRQYFNIPQGDGNSIIVLDEPSLNQVVRRVKTNKLTISSEALESMDAVKLRKDVFAYLKEILDRIDPVAKAEIDNARAIIQTIFDYFDSDEIDEEDILDLANKVKEFYNESNNAIINVKFFSPDLVKKNAKQIAKAIGDIKEILDENDPLTILMTFSGDPIAELQPLLDLFKQLENALMEVDRQLANRKTKLGEVQDYATGTYRYANELEAIDECIALLGSEAQV